MTEEEHLLFKPNGKALIIGIILVLVFGGLGWMMVHDTQAPERVHVVIYIIMLVFQVSALQALHIMGWIIIGMSLLGSCAIGSMFFGGNYLLLTPQGFTICRLFRKRFTPWYEVESFAHFSYKHQKFIGYNFSTLSLKRNSKTSFMFGYQAMFGNQYSIANEQLAVLLNQWKARYYG